MEIAMESRDPVLVRAEAATLAGRDAEARELLAGVRRHALLQGDARGAIRAEVALAWACIAADDDDGALAHAKAAQERLGEDPESRARLWLVRSIQARRAGGEQMPLRDGPSLQHLPRSLAAWLELEAAAWCLRRGESQAACEKAQSALLLVDCFSVASAWARVVLGQAAALQSDWPHARDSFAAGMDALASMGAARVLGRAQLLYALEVAPRLAGSGSGAAVAWLALATRTLGDAATWRDKEQLSEGFRLFGRRTQDAAAGAVPGQPAKSPQEPAAQELTALDALSDGVVVLDSAGEVTVVNSAAARLLQTAPELLRGRTLAADPLLAPLQAALSGGNRFDGATVKLRGNVCVVCARPVGADGSSVVLTIAELDRVRRVVHRATAARARWGFHDIVGETPAMLEALGIARQAASAEASVLITGESGVGKELFAQAIHSGGPRAFDPFLGLGCAGVPAPLLEAELFGCERGALADTRSEGHAGKLEHAAEGTILLDEVGDMPPETQARLARVLQERAFSRVGGTFQRPVRARIIATTRHDLDQLVIRGAFHPDLLRCLRQILLPVPSLADRTTDIALLARTFLARFAQDQRKAARHVSENVLQSLMANTWRGNVRELANVIEREVGFLAPDATVLTRLQAPLPPASDRSDDSQPPPNSGPVLRLAEVERRAFLAALGACGGNIPRAARALGVSKVTFYAKLREWGLHPRDRVAR